MNKSNTYIDNPYTKKQTSKFKVRVPSYKGKVFPFSRFTNYFDTRQEAEFWQNKVVKNKEQALKKESKDQEWVLEMNKFFKTDYIQELSLKLDIYKNAKIEQI